MFSTPPHLRTASAFLSHQIEPPTSHVRCCKPEGCVVKARLLFEHSSSRCYLRTSTLQFRRRLRRASTVAEAGSVQEHVHLIVRVPAYKLEFGQELRLVGAPASLGGWNPAEATPLLWTKGDNWSTMTVLPPGRHEVKVVLTEAGGEVWSEGPNLVITLPDDLENGVSQHEFGFGPGYPSGACLVLTRPQDAVNAVIRDLEELKQGLKAAVDDLASSTQSISAPKPEAVAKADVEESVPKEDAAEHDSTVPQDDSAVPQDDATVPVVAEGSGEGERSEAVVVTSEQEPEVMDSVNDVPPVLPEKQEEMVNSVPPVPPEKLEEQLAATNAALGNGLAPPVAAEGRNGKAPADVNGFMETVKAETGSDGTLYITFREDVADDAATLVEAMIKRSQRQ